MDLKHAQARTISFRCHFIRPQTKSSHLECCCHQVLSTLVVSPACCYMLNVCIWIYVHTDGISVVSYNYSTVMAFPLLLS
ncbi:hypothetical protein ACS0TY_034146 [Phlomoides rotata]